MDLIQPPWRLVPPWLFWVPALFGIKSQLLPVTSETWELTCHPLVDKDSASWVAEPVPGQGWEYMGAKGSVKGGEQCPGAQRMAKKTEYLVLSHRKACSNGGVCAGGSEEEGREGTVKAESVSSSGAGWPLGPCRIPPRPHSSTVGSNVSKSLLPKPGFAVTVRIALEDRWGTPWYRRSTVGVRLPQEPSCREAGCGGSMEGVC